MVLKFVVGHAARLDAFAAIRACEECVNRLHEIIHGHLSVMQKILVHFSRIKMSWEAMLTMYSMYLFIIAVQTAISRKVT